MSSDQLQLVPLSELDPTRRRVTVCVRVSRIWDYHRNGRLEHTDLVLVDEQGNKICAEIAAAHASKYKDLLREGNVYYLRDFFIQSAKNMFRAVDAKFVIKITPWTKIEQRHNVPSTFPYYAYCLTAFEHLPDLVGRKECFIDTIGIVSAISDLMHVRLPGQSSNSVKRNLQIMDIDGRTMDVALWGHNATDFDGEAVYKAAQTEIIIILLVGTLMKSYRGHDTISCGEAGKFYINPDITEKTNYHERIGQQLPIVRWMAAEDDHYHKGIQRSKPEQITIGYLLSTDPNEYLMKNMTCTVTITKLKSTSWWFLACAKCHRTAYPADIQFVCSDETCPCVQANPRYKVRVIGSDNTGEAEFVFFAGVAEQIIGKKADVLTRAAARRPDAIPAEISAFVSQKLTLNISLNERGLQFGELSFQVNSIIAVHAKSNILQFRAIASDSQDEGGTSSSAASLQPVLSHGAIDLERSFEHVSPPQISNSPQAETDPSLSALLASTPPSVTKSSRTSTTDTGSGTKKRTSESASLSDEKKSLAPRKLFKQDHGHTD